MKNINAGSRKIDLKLLEHRKLFLSKKRLRVCYDALRYCYSLITYTKDSPVNVPRKQLPNFLIIEEFKNTSIEANLDIKKFCLQHTACLKMLPMDQG